MSGIEPWSSSGDLIAKEEGPHQQCHQVRMSLRHKKKKNPIGWANTRNMLFSEKLISLKPNARFITSLLLPLPPLNLPPPPPPPPSGTEAKVCGEPQKLSTP